jgi:hypothetical protein
MKIINPHDWVYDLECYPNYFSAAFEHVLTGTRAYFEISERCNHLIELANFLWSLRDAKCRMIGFNNLGYDYPLSHFLLNNYLSGIGYEHLFIKSDSIIQTPWENRFDNIIYDGDILIPQIDLFKIHHFDNEARRTSLKMLEFNMRSKNIQDLPFEPGIPLTLQQMQVMKQYNHHDVSETVKFYLESIDMIEFREELGERYNKNFLNHSDKKIGTEIFVTELEKLSPGCCYTKVNGRKVARQTIRHSIGLVNVILPYIKFNRPEFNKVKDWLSTQVITETKGVFNGLNAEINGFKYDFGTGGIHGSIDSAIVTSDENYVIYDWDVEGFYPMLGAVNNLHPEHLGNNFGVVDGMLKTERAKHKKGTPLNRAVKLSRNGAYGDTNNKYSPFYDPQYTMSITINGQLLLCMLAEHLIDIPDLTMIQINTDGLTVKCPRQHVERMKTICAWWESFTCLTLESVIYNRMFIRDVNSYIGEYENNDVKRKGAYEYKLDWHQNHGQMVVAMAAEAALIDGVDIEWFIKNHDNIYDFMLRTKVGRSDKLVISDCSGNERELQKITRYYIANDGGSLTKISPPAKDAVVGGWKRATKLTDPYYKTVLDELTAVRDGPVGYHRLLSHELDENGLPWDARINTKNKSKYIIRRTGQNVGRLVAPCNDIADADFKNIDYDYYIAETRKLVDPLIN